MAGGLRPYREPAPAPDKLVRWPDAFGTRFLVTVDVEEEFDWRAPFDPNQRSTGAMRAFPEAHRRFCDLGAPLTCFVDHPIAVDPASVEMLRAVVEDGRSEIAAQLHPWVTPPFLSRTPHQESFPGNLPESAEAAKLDRLTEAIVVAFGERPRAYRAGRYGLGPNTRRLLVARGFRVDSSVRARFDYSGEGGPDYRDVGSAAYRSGGLIELPLTTVFTGRALTGGAKLYGGLGALPKGRGVASRLRLFSRVALTPEGMPIADALRAVDTAVAGGLRLLVFSFHSPSLEPSHTPYVRNEADRRRFWAWWVAMFARLDRLGVKAASLEDVVRATEWGSGHIQSEASLVARPSGRYLNRRHLPFE